MGIMQNKKLYYPYLLAGSCMVMFFYIFLSLALSPVVHQLAAEEIMLPLFLLTTVYIGLFSVPFLFYTNASLVRKRKKELGLYNILGMNKKNIMRIMRLETKISSGIVIVLGIFFGTILSKFFEVLFVKISNSDVKVTIEIGWISILVTGIVYIFVFTLILIYTILKIALSKPIDLFRGEMVGEKPPKKSCFLTICSILLIVSGYVIMNLYHKGLVSKPLVLAVGVIAMGSYLFFICASVIICKFLQNRKSYYYQTSNFVSVSSMVFRVKRNGAGLTAICIMSTVILATLSASLCFFIAMNKMVNRMFSHDLGVVASIPFEEMNDTEEILEYTETIQGGLEQIFDAEKDAKYMEIYSANMVCFIQEGLLDCSIDVRDSWFNQDKYSDWVFEKDGQKAVLTRFISIQTYNQLCGTNETLSDDEVMLVSNKMKYQEDNIRLFHGETYRVSKKMKQTLSMSYANIEGETLAEHGCEEIYVVVNNPYLDLGEIEGLKHYKDCNYLVYDWAFELNWMGEENALREKYQDVTILCENQKSQNEMLQIDTYVKTKLNDVSDSVTNSVIFVAIGVNLLLLIVISLIMYYKQISEGYEDQKRFDILKKIGITQKEIKASVHSQMKIVFTLPILVGTLHFLFIPKVLMEMVKPVSEISMAEIAKSMMISYLLFVVFYSIVYLCTSKTYYKIVNSCAQ